MILQIEQPGLTMPNRGYFLSGRDDPRLKAYETMVRKVMLEFGADPTTIDADMNDQIEFEIAIANVTIFYIIDICTYVWRSVSLIAVLYQ